MSRLQSLPAAVLTLATAAAVGAGAWWLITNKPSTPSSEKPPAAATVAKVVKEDDLNTITLSEAAEKRLGLKVGPVEKKKTRRTRVYGGEAAIPAGRSIIVSAPLGGVLKAPANGTPQAGQQIKKGQAILQLSPLLTPDGRATLSASLTDAEGQVNNAKTQLDLAHIALARAQRVLKEGAGSQRQVDEAQAASDLAAKTLDAANARHAILTKVIGDVNTGTAAPVSIDAPQDGLLRVVSALPGQTVPSGAALFEVADLSTVWVRVPLPVGDLDGIDRTAIAEVCKLSASASTPRASAKPVLAPPSATALAGTVDVYYELSNADGRYAPAQRLGVTVPLAETLDGLTAPWSAVVVDIHGGAWVYEQTAARTYVRRRVVVSHTLGADAVLASGPAVGTKIVTEGVQELFGAETGFIK